MSFNVTELLTEYLALEQEKGQLPEQYDAAMNRLKQYVAQHNRNGEGMPADEASEALQIWQEAIRIREKTDNRNEQLERISSQIVNVFNILDVNKLSIATANGGKVTFENNNGVISHD